MLRTIGRLMALIGGLTGPGYRLRLGRRLPADLVRQSAGGVFAAGARRRHQRAWRRATRQARCRRFSAWPASGRRFVSPPPRALKSATPSSSRSAKKRSGARARASSRHVHSLSVRFHQSKRTGARLPHHRARRARHRLPAALSRLQHRADRDRTVARRRPCLASNTAGRSRSSPRSPSFIYAWLTFGVTEWRLKHRREMNEADTRSRGPRRRLAPQLRDREELRRRGPRKRAVRPRAGVLRGRRGEGSNTSLVHAQRGAGLHHEGRPARPWWSRPAIWWRAAAWGRATSPPSSSS